MANSFAKYIGPFTHNINCRRCNAPEDLRHIFNSCNGNKTERDKFKAKQLEIKAPHTYPEFLHDTNPNPDITHKNIINFIQAIGKINSI